MLTGHSPDFLLDGQPHLQCFYQESLSDVVDKLSASLKAVQSKIEVKPANGSALEYACQFKETNYAFLKRLAADLGEWFFYDGKKLYFGKPKDEEPIPLVYGKDSEKLKLGMKLKPLSFGRFAYDTAADKLNVQKAPDGIGGIGDYGSLALDKSKKLFKEESNVSLHIPQTEDRAAKNRLERHGADLFVLEGESRNHLLHVGAVADLKFSVQGEHKPSGKYRLLEVIHQLDAKGNYKNSFRGIPADAPMLPASDIKRPVADAQPAVVVENHDSDGLGRVQVKFLWQKGDVFTPFLRVLRPDFGADEKSGSNRGYFWIPEKGDQVLVQFMDGMPEQPYVAGAMGHGNNKDSTHLEKNHLKSISTRSGHLIEFDEGKGNEKNGWSIRISDRNGNMIKLDTEGKSILISAPETVRIEGKNISIEAEKTIEMKSKDLKSYASVTTKITSGKDVCVTSDEGMITQQADSGMEFITTNNNVLLNAGDSIDVTCPNNFTVSANNVKAEANSNLELEGGGNAKLKAPVTKVAGGAHTLEVK